MARTVYRLTDAEREIIEKSRKDGRYFTHWFFGGWLFDDRIDPAWQLRFHHAEQSEITVIGGVGSAKTTCAAMSAATWAATTHHFKFMNVAPTIYQSQQMFEILMANAENTRFERFIWKTVTKPYPKIVLKHSGIGQSTLEFMSAADDANRILSWEGDWINIDEAGLLDDLDETIIRLGTRLRGTIKGRARLGRLSLTTNPHVNPQLYWRFDMAEELPDEYLSIEVRTDSNKNITEAQLDALLRRIPEAERDRWLNAQRPEGGGNEFPLALVEPCEDEGLDAIMSDGLAQGLPDFVRQIAPKAGVVLWQLPPDRERRYVTVMDPGQGQPPHRNSPVILTWDVTEFPRAPATLRAFWWGFGKGSYQPCLSQFRHYHDLYRPVFMVYDSTGTQAGMGEYFRLEEDLLAYGVNMAGNVKGEALLALKLLMGRQLLFWPKELKGMRRQLLNYRLPDRKIIQDIVSAAMMTALFIRRFYYMEDTPADSLDVKMRGRKDRYDRDARLRAGRVVE